MYRADFFRHGIVGDSRCLGWVSAPGCLILEVMMGFGSITPRLEGRKNTTLAKKLLKNVALATIHHVSSFWEHLKCCMWDS